jgi:hypothetical protein
VPRCHPSVLRSRQLMRHDGGNTLKSQDNHEGLRTLPLNPMECDFVKQTFYKMDEDHVAEHHLRIGALGDAGPIIDARARRQLKRRRDELHERLEAGNFETPEQAAEMRQEMHMINVELRSAIGLGGKERKSADPNERARKVVSKAISRSLETIRHHLPALWQHLHNALRIGYTCSYIPDRPTNWIT